MTLEQFVSKYNGKAVDFDGAYGFQCVDLFRFYNRDVLNIEQPKGVNGAKDFWSNYASDPNLYNNFDKLSNTPEFVPKPGDVMIWNGYYGPYGHIAIVTIADINKFTCLSQNDPTGRETHLKEYTYSKVYGVLRPKVQSTQEFMQIEKKVFENLVTKALKLDEFVGAGYPDAQSVTLSIETYTDRINTLKKDHDNFLREMVTIIDPNTVIEIADQDLVKNLAKQLVNEQSTLQTAKAKLEKESAQREKELEEQIYQQEQRLKRFEEDLERLQKGYQQLKLENDKLKKQKNENNYFADLIIKLFRKK